VRECKCTHGRSLVHRRLGVWLQHYPVGPRPVGIVRHIFNLRLDGSPPSLLLMFAPSSAPAHRSPVVEAASPSPAAPPEPSIGGNIIGAHRQHHSRETQKANLGTHIPLCSATGLTAAPSFPVFLSSSRIWLAFDYKRENSLLHAHRCQLTLLTSKHGVDSRSPPATWLSTPCFEEAPSFFPAVVSWAATNARSATDRDEAFSYPVSINFICGPHHRFSEQHIANDPSPRGRIWITGVGISACSALLVSLPWARPEVLPPSVCHSLLASRPGASVCERGSLFPSPVNSLVLS
jgi:hypothetical protein